MLEAAAQKKWNDYGKEGRIWGTNEEKLHVGKKTPKGAACRWRGRIKAVWKSGGESSE